MAAYNYCAIVSAIENITPDIKEAKFFLDDNDENGIRIIENIQGEWGDIYPFTIKSEPQPLPSKLKARWITIADGKCYELSTDIDSEKMEDMWTNQEKKHPDSSFKFIVVGLAPYGEITIWLRSDNNAVIFQQFKAKEAELTKKEKETYSKMKADKAFVESIITKEQYDGIMKQHTYRYIVLEEYFNGKRWLPFPNEDSIYESIEIQGVEDKCTDGTFDFTDTDNLYKHHCSGMPKQITVRWKENGERYSTHFWLETYYVKWFFESLERRFPSTPAEILVRLDTRANRYEIAMTAKDLKPRTFIGTQYIVFRNDKEISRSKYFFKEEGEWNWK